MVRMSPCKHRGRKVAVLGRKASDAVEARRDALGCLGRRGAVTTVKAVGSLVSPTAAAPVSDLQWGLGELAEEL